MVVCFLDLLSEKSHFPYCEAVMAESQRLGNILPMSLPHTASDDVIVGGYRIPKGAVVIPNLDSANPKQHI
jgi:cytochrome P450 family 2 subfamily K